MSFLCRGHLVSAIENVTIIFMEGHTMMKVIQLGKSYLTLASIVMLLQGCGALRQYHPLPEQYEQQAQVPGFKDIRAWADMPNKALEQSALDSLKQERAANQGKPLPELNALALSGGGSDGAFGAGFLCGWTKSGTRPTFKLVTGISTGALMAPFAFLGPSYDTELKRIYTSISDESIYKPYSLFSIFMSVINLQSLPSMASSEQLAKLIEREVTPSMLQRIAEEHRKGRRLLIGTTQFNAQRLVIWNMGKIAEQGTPQALALFRKILLASASLPVTFPPQYFTVTAYDKTYEEMHVDGGVEAQVMLYENAILPFSQARELKSRLDRPRQLYIIRNERLYPEWENVKPTLKTIAVRSIDSLVKSQGVGDLYRLYAYSMRDKINYHLIFIPDTFNEKEKTPFDQEYMRKVFALGYHMGERKKDPWYHYPPGYDPV
jgi:hypothetical protein